MTQTFEGNAVAIEGNQDWETCETPGLAHAYHVVNESYRQKKREIFEAVNALAPQSDDADDLFVPLSQEQKDFRKRLEQEAQDAGYSSGFVGEGTDVWCMETPVGRITITSGKEFLIINQDIDGASVGRQHVKVELF